MADENEPEDVIEVEQAPEPVEEVEDVFEELGEDHEDGLGTKVVTAFGILIVGGVLALWLGPKVAPVLPAGMAPVAAWLAPGGAQNREEVEALRIELDERFLAIPTGITTSDVEDIVSLRVSNVEGRMSAKVDALSGVVNRTNGENVEARLAELELVTEGLRAELSSLVSQFTEITVAGGEVSADTAARITTYGAALDGLKAEIEALAAQNGALSQKVDDVSMNAAQKIEEAENIAGEAVETAEISRTNSVITANLTAIDTALSAGLPFSGPLVAMIDAGVDVPEGLASAADGVASMASLRADFPDAAHAAIRASIRAKGDGGLGSNIGTFFRSQVASRSLTPQEGDSADAILSRAEAALKADDLTVALDEISGLPAISMSSEERGPMGDWVANAKKRLAAVEAFAAMSTTLGVE